MSATALPTFHELRCRFGAATTAFDAPAGEAARVVDYLGHAGATVRSADDIVSAIQSLSDEEELAAFRCREGVAVSHASDGWWLLLPSEHCLEADGREAVFLKQPDTAGAKC